MMVVHMLSPDDCYDQLYVSNYALDHVRDLLLRLDGVGDLQHLRRPRILAARLARSRQARRLRLTAGDVVAAVQEQNVQVSGGCARPASPRLRTPPSSSSCRRRGASTTAPVPADHRQRADGGRLVRVRTSRASSSARATTSTNSYLNGKPAVALAHLPAPGHQCARTPRTNHPDDEASSRRDFPPGIDYEIVYNPTEFIAECVQRGLQDAVRGRRPRRPRRHRLPAVVAHGDHPDRRDPGLAHRHVRGDERVRLLAQHPDPVRPGAGDRHRRRRCHRRRRERRAQHRAGHVAARGGAQDHGRGRRARCIAIALVLAAVFVPTAFIPGISGQFYRQFALTIAVSTIISAFNSLTLSPALWRAAVAGRTATSTAALLPARRPLARDGLQSRLRQELARLFARGATSRRGEAVLLAMLPSMSGSSGTTSGVATVPTGFIPSLDQGYVDRRHPDSPTARRCRGPMRSCRVRRRSCARRPACRMRSPSRASPARPSPTPRTPPRSSPRFNRSRSACQGGPASERRHRQLFGRMQAIKEAFIIVVPPPPVRGLGNAGGFKMQLQDRSGVGLRQVLAARPS